MTTLMLISIYVALAAASWHVAQALLQYSMGSAVAIDSPYRRLWLVWFLLLVGFSQPVGLPWGPLLDAVWWLALIFTFELPAAQGVRLFGWLLLAGFVMRLALMGLMQFLT